MLHFLLIGIALFGAYRWMAPGDSDGRRIIITQGVVDDLVTQHVAAKGREPSGTELNDTDLDTLTRYISLLGVGARRNLSDAQVQQGETLFASATAQPATRRR